MRRTYIININLVLFIILAGICSIGSFSFDQLVIQQEDKVRGANNTREIANTKFAKYDSKSNLMDNIQIRNFAYLAEAEAYKYLPLQQIHELISNNSSQRSDAQNTLFSNYFNFLIRYHAFKTNISGQIYTHNWEEWDDWNLKDNLNNSDINLAQRYDDIRNYENNLLDQYLMEYGFDKATLVIPDLSNNEIYDVFIKSLEMIQHSYEVDNLLNDLSDHYEKKCLEYEALINEKGIEKLSLSIRKNYFILTSISLQIASLLFLLLLFRTIIKVRALANKK